MPFTTKTVKAAEAALIAQRQQQEYLKEEQRQLEEQLSKNPLFVRLQAIKADLTAANKDEKTLKTVYAGMVQELAADYDNPSAQDFAPHVKLVHQNYIVVNDERMLDVVQWFIDHDLFEEMVEIKTSGKLTTMRDYMPIYDKDGNILIWEDWTWTARVDSGVWEFIKEIGVEEETK